MTSVCPLKCYGCADNAHHFSDNTLEYAATAPDHPAAQSGHVAWFECLHCDAWAEIVDLAADDDNDEELTPGTVHEVTP